MNHKIIAGAIIFHDGAVVFAAGILTMSPGYLPKVSLLGIRVGVAIAILGLIVCTIDIIVTLGTSLRQNFVTLLKTLKKEAGDPSSTGLEKNESTSESN